MSCYIKIRKSTNHWSYFTISNEDYESLLLYWDRTQLEIGNKMIETVFSADCNDGSRCYSVEEK